MYQIKELAERTGVNPSAIRYYEEIGVLPPAPRADNGYRVYGEADLERLHFITRARDLDFSLDEISEVLHFREQGRAPCAYVIKQIDRKIAEIDRKVAALIQLKSELQQLQNAAQRLPLAEIQAKSCVCHLIENRQLITLETQDRSDEGTVCTQGDSP